MDLQAAFDAGFDAVKRYVDASAAAFDRRVADIEHAIERDAALRDAQFAVRMAELETRIASVNDLERKVSDRLATLKDGKDGTDGRDGTDAVSPSADEIAALLVDEAKSVAAATARSIVDAWERPKDGVSVTIEDVEPMLREMVAAIPPAKDGRDGEHGKDSDPETVRQMVDEAMARIPVPKDGKDGERGADGKDGASVTIDDVAPVIAATIAEAVAAIPVPKDGRDGRDGADGKPGERGASVDSIDIDLVNDGSTAIMRFAVGETEHKFEVPLPRGLDGADGKDGERGAEGPVGVLPVVKAWEDGVYYRGNVVAFAGATYQASRDTGKAPPHADWTCIVAKGADGADGRSFTVRGTYAEDGEYDALDVVALNGAGFVAKRDNPGACPGEGWQMIAMQGKPGKPGQKGDPGMGMRGLPGPTVDRMDVDGNGLLTLVNADGTTVECDLYPLLSQIGGR